MLLFLYQLELDSQLQRMLTYEVARKLQLLCCGCCRRVCAS